ncbi:hypothetical protein PCANC_10150 [Puccinia coronata f. sp. avenae]|uniref:Cyclin-like domain-containing protein n=1 Tax=Puccinia coronata f. sp. avenae TaxID=200324 RepID=A0A2N5V6B9_9BASI|nr:hypothetical protein PCANC_10150 [Puccinia coronata f. sp. avenae]
MARGDAPVTGEHGGPSEWTMADRDGTEISTLRNPLANPAEPTPSAVDAIPAHLERELRLYGALLIQQAGVLLKLPQIVMATAATLFQRFFFVTSFLHFGIRDVSAGALFLASKLEEKPARIRDIINVYDYLQQLIEWSRVQASTPGEKARDAALISSRATREAEHKIQQNPLLPDEIKTSMIRHLQLKRADLPADPVHGADGSSTPDPDPDATAAAAAASMAHRLDVARFSYLPMDYFAQTFYDRKEEIVVAEMQILKRLGFHVQVQHPYSAMVNYLQVLNLTENTRFSQRAWGALNDSLLTTLPALYPATHLGTLAIYVAAKESELRLPEEWWSLFDVSDESELVEMAGILQAIYPRSHLSSSSSSDDDDDDAGNKISSIWVRVSGLPVTKDAARAFFLQHAPVSQ